MNGILAKFILCQFDKEIEKIKKRGELKNVI